MDKLKSWFNDEPANNTPKLVTSLLFDQFEVRNEDDLNEVAQSFKKGHLIEIFTTEDFASTAVAYLSGISHVLNYKQIHILPTTHLYIPVTIAINPFESDSGQ